MGLPYKIPSLSLFLCKRNLHSQPKNTALAQVEVTNHSTSLLQETTLSFYFFLFSFILFLFSFSSLSVLHPFFFFPFQTLNFLFLLIYEAFDRFDRASSAALGVSSTPEVLPVLD